MEQNIFAIYAINISISLQLNTAEIYTEINPTMEVVWDRWNLVCNSEITSIASHFSPHPTN